MVLGREAQGFFDFVDVESIEVIKGPQGTLFGKNASAGVINIRTKAPEFDFGGSADISYGSFDEIKIRLRTLNMHLESRDGILSQWKSQTQNLSLVSL